MILRIISLVFVLLISLVQAYAIDDASTLQTVMKLKVYEKNSISGDFSYLQWGSAVLIDKNRIITNAHVVLDDNEVPTGFYEVCSSDNSTKPPVCFSGAKLIAYDIVADLAVLELTTPKVLKKNIVFSDKRSLSIWSNVIVYGYPDIWGNTITRTEWKIGWLESDVYKFDGTIDHGNSGWGAFDTDGKLIGIPYAMKSDNGMIGYIIPVSKVRDFLAGKTYNYEKYIGLEVTDFLSYIKQNQSISRASTTLKTPSIEIRDIQKNGFSLSSTVSSTQWDIFQYKFMHKNQRVAFGIECSRDASITWRGSEPFIRDTLKNTEEHPSSYALTSSDITPDILETRYTAIKDTKWEKIVASYFYYKSAPACYAFVVANDGVKKDKDLMQKAINIVKNIRFTAPKSVNTEFRSSFFNVLSIPANVYFSQSIGVYGSESSPNIAINFSKRFSTSAQVYLRKYESLDDYMNLGYSDSNRYIGTDYSFSAFFNRYKTVGYTKVKDYEVITRTGEKLIMTVSDNTDRDITPIRYSKTIEFFYPFLTGAGEYRAYRFSFDIPSDKDEDVARIREVIESIDFIGNSPFKN